LIFATGPRASFCSCDDLRICTGWSRARWQRVGGPNRLLGYVANMAATTAATATLSKRSSAHPTSHRACRSPASGPCHSTPSWHVTAIEGSLSRNCPRRPWGAPWTMSRNNFWTASNPTGSLTHEIPLRPLR
jgi:hypothetical protein